MFVQQLPSPSQLVLPLTLETLESKVLYTYVYNHLLLKGVSVLTFNIDSSLFIAVQIFP